MAVERVTIGGGEITSQTMPSSDKYASSENYQGGGVTVRTGAFNREVHSTTDLNDNDMMTVNGMELTVAQARQFGLLNSAFDDQLSDAAAAKATQDDASTTKQTPEQPQGSDTGYPEYDEAIDNLNAALEDGTMHIEEAKNYDTVMAEVAMAGLSVDKVLETIDGLNDGSISELDVEGDTRSMITSIEKTVTDAATKSAIDELGQEGFDFLQQAAQTHPGVNSVIRAYAIDRARGQTEGVTWADLAADLQEQLGYR